MVAMCNSYFPCWYCLLVVDVPRSPLLTSTYPEALEPVAAFDALSALLLPAFVPGLRKPLSPLPARPYL